MSKPASQRIGLSHLDSNKQGISGASYAVDIAEKKGYDSYKDVTLGEVLDYNTSINGNKLASRQQKEFNERILSQLAPDKKELENLNMAERLWQQGVTGTAEATSGLINFARGVLGEDVTDSGSLINVLQRQEQMITDNMPEGSTFEKEWLAPAVRMAPDLLAASALGIATGGTGAFLYTTMREGGSMLKDMEEKGIDKSIAIPLSILGGAINGGVELLTLKTIMPKRIAGKLGTLNITDKIYKGIAKFAPKILKKKGIAIPAQIGVKGLINALAESGEEGIQDVVSLVTNDIGQGLNDKVKGESEFKGFDFKKYLTSGIDSFVTSLKPMLITGGLLGTADVLLGKKKKKEDDDITEDKGRDILNNKAIPYNEGVEEIKESPIETEKARTLEKHLQDKENLINAGVEDIDKYSSAEIEDAAHLTTILTDLQERFPSQEITLDDILGNNMTVDEFIKKSPEQQLQFLENRGNTLFSAYEQQMQKEQRQIEQDTGQVPVEDITIEEKIAQEEGAPVEELDIQREQAAATPEGEIVTEQAEEAVLTPAEEETVKETVEEIPEKAPQRPSEKKKAKTPVQIPRRQKTTQEEQEEVISAKETDEMRKEGKVQEPKEAKEQTGKRVGGVRQVNGTKAALKKKQPIKRKETAKGFNNGKITVRKTNPLYFKPISESISKKFNIPVSEAEIKSVSLNNKSSQSLKKIAKAIGLDIDYFVSDNPRLSKIFGMASENLPGRVLINAKSKAPHLQILGHEAMHQIQIMDKKLSEDFFNALKPYIKDYGKYSALMKAAGYKDSNVIAKEFTADLAGQLFMDKSFWEKLAKEKPNVFKKLAIEILQLIKKVMAYLSKGSNINKEYISDINKVEDIVVSTFKKFSETADKKNLTGIPSDIKYMIGLSKKEQAEIERDSERKHTASVIAKKKALQKPERLAKAEIEKKFEGIRKVIRKRTIRKTVTVVKGKAEKVISKKDIKIEKVKQEAKEKIADRRQKLKEAKEKRSKIAKILKIFKKSSNMPTALQSAVNKLSEAFEKSKPRARTLAKASRLKTWLKKMSIKTQEMKDVLTLLEEPNMIKYLDESSLATIKDIIKDYLASNNNLRADVRKNLTDFLKTINSDQSLIQKIEGIEDIKDALIESGIPSVYISNKMQKTINRLESSKRPLSKMTLEEINDLYESLAKLNAMWQNYKKLKTAKRRIEKNELMQEINDAINFDSRPDTNIDNEVFFKKINKFFKGYFRGHQDLKGFARLLQRGKKGGLQILTDIAREGKRKSELLQKEILKDWGDFFKNHRGIPRWLFREAQKPVLIHTSQGDVQITQGQRLYLYMLSKNKKGSAHLIGSKEGKNKGGFSLPNKLGRVYNLIEQDLNNIEKSLTKPEIDFSNLVNATFDKLYKQMNEVFEKMEGRPLTKEDFYSRIFVHPFYTGAEGNISTTRNAFKESGWLSFANGAMEDRTGSTAPIVVHDIKGTTLSSMTQATNYIGQEEGLYTISTVLNDKNFKSQIINKFGNDALKFLKDWGHGLVDENISARDLLWYERLIKTLTNNTTLGILMYRLITGPKQYASLLTAAPEVGRWNLMKGAVKWVLKSPASRKAYIKELGERDPLIWSRFFKGFQKELSGVYEGEGALNNLAKSYAEGKISYDSFKKLGMEWIKYNDRNAIGILSMAVEEKIAGKTSELLNDELKFKEHARDKLIDIIENTQPIGFKYARSGMSRTTNPLLKPFLMFTSATNKIIQTYTNIWSNYRETINNPSSTKADKKQAGVKMLADWGTVSLGNGILLSALDCLWRLMRGKEEPEDIFDPANIAKNIGMYSLSSFYFMGPVVFGLRRMLESGSSYGVDIGGSAVSDAIGSGFKGAVMTPYNVAQYIKAQTPYEQDKIMKRLKKSLRETAKGGALFALPVVGLDYYDMIKYWIEGKPPKAPQKIQKKKRISKIKPFR